MTLLQSLQCDIVERDECRTQDDFLSLVEFRHLPVADCVIEPINRAEDFDEVLVQFFFFHGESIEGAYSKGKQIVDWIANPHKCE